MRRKRFLAITTAIMFLLEVFSVIIPFTSVKANESTNITDKFQFITDVKLTDGDGNPLGDNVDKKSEIRVSYDWSIPNDETVKEGDFYTMQLPSQIHITQDINEEITDGGNKIADVHIGTDGNVKITFSEYESQESDVTGSFYANCNFRESDIENENSVSLTFNLQGSEKPVIINVNFGEPAPVDNSVEEPENQDPSTNESINEPVDITDKFQFITGVKLTDGDGNPLEGNVDKKSEIRVSYDWSIPNDETVKEGDFYRMQLPPQIHIVQDINQPINDDDGNKIADMHIGTDGSVKITFTKYASEHSNVKGYIYASCHFKEEEIGNENPVKITFNLQGDAKPVTIEVDFEQPAPVDTSIIKYGEYNSSTNEITWKVEVNREKVKVKDAVIKDDIPIGQQYVEGSTEFDGNPTSDGFTYIKAAYGDSSKTGTLTYKFNDVIDKTTHTITFKTKVTDPKAFESHGKVTRQYNKAILIHDGTSTESNDAYVEVNINYINKSGWYSGERKQIDWTININNNAQSITNAKVTDNIPEGLTLDESSVKVDGKSVSDYTYNNNIFEYTFKGTINEPHTITFSTDVTDPDAYNSNNAKYYENEAILTGEGVPGDAKGTGTVGVPTSIIQKQGINYDASTSIITWRITVNTNKILIGKGAVVTDHIPIGQQYVEGSTEFDGKPITDGFTYTKALDGDKEKTGTLIYRFNGPIDKTTHTIIFKTKITDPNVYAANTSKDYHNTATLTQPDIPTSKSTGWQRVSSQVIQKSGKDYDYVTKEITWEIKVNKNRMPITNAVVEDAIPEGQEFAEGSVMIGGKEADSKNYSFDFKERIFRYRFPEKINTEQTITFKTRIIDLSIFNTNGNKVVSNTASLIGDEIPPNVKSTGTQTIKNSVVSKVANYTSGNSYIDWEVIINSASIPIKDATITDQLQEGLVLDTDTVKLYKMTVDTKGILTQGEEVLLNKENVKYDIETREFTFNFPGSIDGAFKLTFRTDATKTATFTNSVSFSGTGIIENSTSKPVGVWYSTGGGGGTGQTGKINIVKVDSNDSTKKLKGAVFQLLDRYENVIKVSQSTGDDGSVLFDKLKFDIDYSIKELVAPEGYNLSDEVYTFQLKGRNDEKSITYEYVNDKITGIIEFKKTEENAEESGLQGAEFTLYKSDDTNYQDPINTAISDENGIVQFKNVEYGSYSIKETKAPDGYNPSSQVLNATISENGATVKVDPYTVPNTKIRGNIEFIKVGQNENPLKGAEFKLYKSDDTAYKNPIDTAISDENGIVQFKDVEYGNYNIKETKAISGYYLSYKTLTASINEHGVTVHANPYKFVNTKITSGGGGSGGSGGSIKGTVNVKKVDENDKPLKGVEFALIDANENLIQLALTDDKGVAQFKDVSYGKYTVKETKPLEGYAISNETIFVEVNQNGKTYDIGTIKNTKIRGAIEINKVDKNKKPLSGAEFTLYHEDGRIVKTAISRSDGIVLFEGLGYGNYTAKETKAPKGYVLSNEVIIVSIGSSETQKFTVQNEVEKASVEDKKPGKDTSKDNKPGKSSIAQNEIAENEKNPNENSSNKNNKILPKTGSIIDTTVLMVIGILLILVGAGLIFKEEKMKKSN
ncbi:LPXTG cell wall anchor domain-containing protein [Clostridium sp. MSJ-11]|uniref:LPXTG cell wall anchor domain-containing protein n=1 Tax=Clostridium mobile TaxID=2841512 RepID=A0ABS6EDF3_9CLOT|nr:SpaA isopeptide-forming pilin-related protein [Clostridium mobile]MBU5483231.1 LPXTG cell wall anchor domain-containing protein [Clostridium mobile]